MLSHFKLECTSPVLSWQEQRSEVELILSHQGEALPVEVKSGNITRAKSLEKCIGKYHPQNAFILSGNKPAIYKSKELKYLPLYLVERILDFIHN